MTRRRYPRRSMLLRTSVRWEWECFLYFNRQHDSLHPGFFWWLFLCRSWPTKLRDRPWQARDFLQVLRRWGWWTTGTIMGQAWIPAWTPCSRFLVLLIVAPYKNLGWLLVRNAPIQRMYLTGRNRPTQGSTRRPVPTK